MEFEGIYLHGGAKGFSFINDRGTQAEYDSFFRRFYDKITKAAISIQKIESVNKSFIIESLSINEKQFYDYTFMEHYVYDVSGRASYFGITIRLGAFYCEISDLFFILDTLFKKDIIGNLLLPKESTYMCAKEQIDRQLCEKVMNDIVQLSSSVLQDSNLKSIRSASGEKGICLNLIDCQPKIVEKAITQYGRVTVTTDAPLQRESKSEQEIDRLNKEWAAKWNDLQGKHTAAVNNIQGLNGTIQSLQGQLSQAQNDLQKVQREFGEYKSKNELDYEVINGLKEEKQALLKLAGFVNSLGIEEKQQAHGSQRINKKHDNYDNNRNGQEEDNGNLRFKLKPYSAYIILVIVNALTVWFLLSLKDCSGKGFLSFENADKTSVAKVTEQPVGKTVSNTGNTGNAVQQTNGNSAVSEDVVSGDANNFNNIDFNTLTIDVAEFTKTVKHMKQNSAYTIRICDNVKFKPVEDIKGRWQIQDSDFYIVNSDSAETIITPIRSGNDLTIKFFVEGHETPLQRTIMVK